MACVCHENPWKKWACFFGLPMPYCTMRASQKRYSKRYERLDDSGLQVDRMRGVFGKRAVPCSRPILLTSHLAGMAHQQRGDPVDAMWGVPGRHHSVPLPLRPYENDLCATNAPIPLGVPSSITSPVIRPACLTHACRSDKGCTFPSRVRRARCKA
jgi:hypothetical protein